MTFEQYVIASVDDMVSNGSVLILTWKNNDMIKHGIKSTLGVIETNSNNTIYYTVHSWDCHKSIISEKRIRSNFNKEAYIKLLLKRDGVFDNDRYIMYHEYTNQKKETNQK